LVLLLVSRRPVPPPWRAHQKIARLWSFLFPATPSGATTGTTWFAGTEGAAPCRPTIRQPLDFLWVETQRLQRCGSAIRARPQLRVAGHPRNARGASIRGVAARLNPSPATRATGKPSWISKRASTFVPRCERQKVDALPAREFPNAPARPDGLQSPTNSRRHGPMAVYSIEDGDARSLPFPIRGRPPAAWYYANRGR